MHFEFEDIRGVRWRTKDQTMEAMIEAGIKDRQEQAKNDIWAKMVTVTEEEIRGLISKFLGEWGAYAVLSFEDVFVKEAWDVIEGKVQKRFLYQTRSYNPANIVWIAFVEETFNEEEPAF
jgi:hypothetical protein